MMPKLRKAGLFMMFIGAAIATIYVFAYGYMYNINPHFYFDIWLFVIISLPTLVITAISWRWPFAGGSIAAGLSVMALLYFVASAINPSMEPRADYFFLAITLSFLIGSIMILKSSVNTGQEVDGGE